MKILRWCLWVVMLAGASRFFAFEQGVPLDPVGGTPVWVFDHGYHAGLVIPREGLERFGEGSA